MKDHGGNQAGQRDPGDGAATALPPLLARRCRALAEAMDRVVTTPFAVTLNERERGQGLAILHRLVDGVERDLRHYLGAPAEPSAWAAIAPRGLPIANLADVILANVLEHGLDRPGIDAVSPPFIGDDPALASLWTAYLVAECRTRNAWNAPVLPMSGLPLEMQAQLVDCVAGALIGDLGEDGDTMAAMVAAADQVTQLHREETSIEIVAARFVDGALSQRSPDELMVDLVNRAAWPAVAALVGERTGLGSAPSMIALAVGDEGAIRDWLAPACFGANAVGALVRALAPGWNARSFDDAGVAGADADGWPADRADAIAHAAARYRASDR
ncbi:MAG: hypothetical protein GW859_10750 [Sphingomonadales bacterium]|nr:hypothetical protein [Sphingomonadales bacterium]